MRNPQRSLGLLASLVLVGCSPVASAALSASPAASGVVGTPLAPSPTAATQASANPSPNVTPAPTPTADWTPVRDQADVRAVQFQDVVWTGTRFVAVGIAAAGGGGGGFLDSDDGMTWHLQSHDPAGTPMRIAAGRDGIVALGWDEDGRAVSWHSADGLTWSGRSARFGAASGDDTLEVTDVVATDTGWLAVGREDPPCQFDCGHDPVRALAWSSVDGLAWTRVPNQAALRGGAMQSVVRAGSGFVAVGNAGINAAVWTSANGTTWARVPDRPVLHADLSAEGDAVTAMSWVATGDDVIVAVGSEYPIDGDQPPTARAWWSSDGVTWVEAAGDRFAEGQLFAVAATPRGFLATGPSGGRSCRGGTWASVDGRAWSCTASAPAYEGMAPYAAASSSTIEIVVGLNSADEPPDEGFPGGVWWRSIP